MNYQHTDLEIPDISIEEFDAMNEKHIFSEEYNQKKKQLLRSCHRGMHRRQRHAMGIAASLAILLLSSPFLANAAMDGALFQRLWGNESKTSIAAHEDVVYDAEKGTSYTVNYPAQEFVAVDEANAQKLIGENISFEPFVQEIDGTTLSILSVVRDSHAVIVEFTLENPSGVNCLNFDSLTNETKGADFSDASTFHFSFLDVKKQTNCDGKIFVDSSRSTDKQLYCYDYMTFDGDDLSLQIRQYPCTLGEYLQADNTEDPNSRDSRKDIKTTTYSITTKEAVAETTYTSTSGGLLTVSPLSMNIQMKQGLGLSAEEAYDPFNCYYVEIQYKDGSTYVVTEENREGIHSCDVEKNNTSYICGNNECELSLLFNRLVDTRQIEKIQINETIYTSQK